MKQDKLQKIRSDQYFKFQCQLTVATQTGHEQTKQPFIG